VSFPNQSIEPDKEYTDSEEGIFSRRKLLSSIFAGLTAPYIGKASLDTYVHGEIQYNNPSAVEDLAHPPALNSIQEGELGLHLVNIEDESGPGYDIEKGLEAVERQLSGLESDLSLNIDKYEIKLPEQLEQRLGSTKVKKAREVTSEIREMLESQQRMSVDESDIVMYIGGFESDNLDYVGTAFHNDSGAVSNKKNDIYTTNQVLHNIGHKLGLPHTLSEDVMTWSLYKTVFSSKKIFGFHEESERNLEKAKNHHL